MLSLQQVQSSLKAPATSRKKSLRWLAYWSNQAVIPKVTQHHPSTLTTIFFQFVDRLY
jgi:hypothetical protein